MPIAATSLYPPAFFRVVEFLAIAHSNEPQYTAPCVNSRVAEDALAKILAYCPLLRGRIHAGTDAVITDRKGWILLHSMVFGGNRHAEPVGEHPSEDNIFSRLENFSLLLKKFMQYEPIVWDSPGMDQHALAPVYRVTENPQGHCANAMHLFDLKLLLQCTEAVAAMPFLPLLKVLSPEALRQGDRADIAPPGKFIIVDKNLVFGPDGKPYFMEAPALFKAFGEYLQQLFIEHIALVIRLALPSTDPSTCAGFSAPTAAALVALIGKAQQCGITQFDGFLDAFRDFRVQVENRPGIAPYHANQLRRNAVLRLLAIWPNDFLETKSRFGNFYRNWLVDAHPNEKQSALLYPLCRVAGNSLVQGAVIRAGACVQARVILPRKWIVEAGCAIGQFEWDLLDQRSIGSVLTGDLILERGARLKGPVRFGKNVSIGANLHLPGNVRIADGARVVSVNEGFAQGTIIRLPVGSLHQAIKLSGFRVTKQAQGQGSRAGPGAGNLRNLKPSAAAPAETSRLGSVSAAIAPVTVLESGAKTGSFPIHLASTVSIAQAPGPAQLKTVAGAKQTHRPNRGKRPLSAVGQTRVDAQQAPEARKKRLRQDVRAPRSAVPAPRAPALDDAKHSLPAPMDHDLPVELPALFPNMDCAAGPMSNDYFIEPGFRTDSGEALRSVWPDTMQTSLHTTSVPTEINPGDDHFMSDTELPLEVLDFNAWDWASLNPAATTPIVDQACKPKPALLTPTAPAAPDYRSAGERMPRMVSRSGALEPDQGATGIAPINVLPVMTATSVEQTTLPPGLSSMRSPLARI